MGRRWSIEVDGQSHLVEGHYNSLLNTGRGTVTVDGTVVDAWGSGWLGMPRERTFTMLGKPAILRKTGLLIEDHERFFDGRMIPHDR